MISSLPPLTKYHSSLREVFPKLAKGSSILGRQQNILSSVYPSTPALKRKRERPIWSLITSSGQPLSLSSKSRNRDKNVAAVSFPLLASRLACRLDREGQPSVPGGKDSAQTWDHLFQCIHLFYRPSSSKSKCKMGCCFIHTRNSETVAHLKGYGMHGITDEPRCGGTEGPVTGAKPPCNPTSVSRSTRPPPREKGRGRGLCTFPLGPGTVGPQQDELFPPWACCNKAMVIC